MTINIDKKGMNWDNVFVVEEELEPHSIAMIIPEIPEDEFEELKMNIAAKGLLEPIVIWQDKILDGRHRYKACSELGIEVYAYNWEEGMDPVEYVVSKNIMRRHLTPAQRAVAATKAINYHAEQAKKRQQEAGRFAGRDENGNPKLQVVEPVPQPEENQSQGKSRDQVGKLFNVSGRSVSSAKYIMEHGTEEEKESLTSGKAHIKPLEKQIREREKQLQSAEREVKAKSTFNFTNDNIEWAKWTWNPVTGCKHGCPYCYARDIAMRFTGHFKPEFHEDRLGAPFNTKISESKKEESGIKNVFVCSMADLFGDWVSEEWIEQVLDTVKKADQWNYLFLTKNPKRYADFDFPDNCWLGATADIQKRADVAIEVFNNLDVDNIKFLSCEPLLEKISIKKSKNLDWLIIGARSKTSDSSAFQPEWEWVESLHMEARKKGFKVYWKPNLEVRPKEYPKL